MSISAIALTGANASIVAGAMVGSLVFTRLWWTETRGADRFGGAAYMFGLIAISMTLIAVWRSWWQVYYVADLVGADGVATWVTGQAPWPTVIFCVTTGFVKILHVRYAWTRWAGGAWLPLAIAMLVLAFAAGALVPLIFAEWWRP